MFGMLSSAEAMATLVAALRRRLSAETGDGAGQYEGGLTHEVLRKFVRMLESFVSLPGFAKAIVNNADTMALLRIAIGDRNGPKPSAEALRDPTNTMFKGIESLLTKSPPEVRKEALRVATEKGVLAMLLLLLGDAASVSPVNEAWALHVQDPSGALAVVRAAKEKARAEAERKRKEARDKAAASGGRNPWAAGTGCVTCSFKGTLHYTN